MFSGSSHPQLTAAICRRLGIRPAGVRLSKFSNQETNVQIDDSVRDQDVYIVQSGCGRVNDNLIELMIMIAACRTASAARVTAVIPCFPYARQSDGVYRGSDLTMDPEEVHILNSPSATSVASGKDQHSVEDAASPLNAAVPDSPVLRPSGYKEWTARPGNLIANMLTAAGAHHIITMDLHDPQFQGYFDIPVDVVYAEPSILNYIRLNVPDYRRAVIVSPDAGGAKRATSVAIHLGMDFALIHRDGNKRRPARLPTTTLTEEVLAVDAVDPTKQGTMAIVGNVKGRRCIIIDDIADTCRTLCKAAKTLRKHGASQVMSIVTHGILSKPNQVLRQQLEVQGVLDMLERSGVDRLVVTNTIPQQDRDDACPMEKQRWQRWRDERRFEVIDISGTLAEAIRRSHNGESVSYLFRDR